MDFVGQVDYLIGMSFTPNSPIASPGGTLATGEVLERIRGLLDSVDHEGRRSLDAEARVSLVNDAVELGRRIDALRAVLVGEAEKCKAAESTRGTSLRSLLASQAQVTPGEAAGWAYAARAFEDHDKVQSAALAGDVSLNQVRAIDGVLTELPPTLTDAQRDKAEQVLLAKAKTLDAKTLATQTRAVLEEVAPEVDAVANELERLDAQRRRARASRAFSMYADGRGSMLIRGQLPVLEASPLQQLVAAYVESDRRARRHEADRLDVLSETRTPEQRRADALVALVAAHTNALRSGGYLCEPEESRAGSGSEATALPGIGAHGESPGGDGFDRRGPGGWEPDLTHDESSGPGSRGLGRRGPGARQSDGGKPGSLRPGVGRREEMVDAQPPATPRQPNAGGAAVGRVPLVAGDRPRVSVMMNYRELRDQAEQAGLLVDGTKISAGDLRRLLCDAEIVPVVLGSDSQVMDVGRAHRLVTPGIRRALSLRDGGCAFPGCNVPDTGCEAHHVVPWWTGGTTSLNNLVLLCPHHHGTVEPLRFRNHDSPPRWQVRIAEDGYPEFLQPARRGTTPTPIRHARTRQRSGSASRPKTGERPPPDP